MTATESMMYGSEVWDRAAKVKLTGKELKKPNKADQREGVKKSLGLTLTRHYKIEHMTIYDKSWNIIYRTMCFTYLTVASPNYRVLILVSSKPLIEKFKITFFTK